MKSALLVIDVQRVLCVGVRPIIVLLVLCASATSAQETSTGAQLPWLQLKIAEYQKLPPFSPPRSILRAMYQGKAVYYVSPACCDIPSELYDATGSLVCYPDGGFAGGDGRCPSFTFVGNTVSVVWRDGRGQNLRPKQGPMPKP